MRQLAIRKYNDKQLGGPKPRLFGSFSRLSGQTPPLLQRNAACACGGGCPDCKAEAGFQTKLAISEPGDAFELEADRVADQVMRMPAPTETISAESGNETSLQRRAADSATTPSAPTGAPPIVHDVLRSPGQPLDAATRAFMEPRFGHDFSHVRVHTDDSAAQSTRAVNALAYTVGQEVVFGAGAYRPSAASGRRLLAHELAHVAQGVEGRLARVPRCTSRTDENAIVHSHTVNNAVIESPGDEATITVNFTCRPRSLVSEIVDNGNNVIKTSIVSRGQGLDPEVSGDWNVTWDGMRGFTDVGTFMATDGTYRHRISNVAYAAGASSDRIAAGGGVLSTSPNISVRSRAEISSGPTRQESRHLFTPMGRRRSANVEALAGAIRGEAGADFCNDAERRAIAWAIRNEMARINSYSVTAADSAFHFANRTPRDSDRTIAENVLSQNMSQDTTSGSIKWYSPRSMPPNSGRCSTAGGSADCSGGLVTLDSDASRPAADRRSSQAPGFHLHMTYVPVAGVREWNFRFYRL